jgi:hypothetical protein
LKQFLVTKEVMAFIKAQDQDFRVCTYCGGPVLLPVSVRRPKPTDIKVPVGDHAIYVSATQARYIDVIDDSMLASYMY